MKTTAPQQIDLVNLKDQSYPQNSDTRHTFAEAPTNPTHEQEEIKQNLFASGVSSNSNQEVTLEHIII